MLDEKTASREKAKELIKEKEGLYTLENVIKKGLSTVKKFFVETNSKNIILKELEISRKENIEKIEKMYNNTNSYLIMKRLIDVANEINEKYHYAVDEVEKIYSSNKNTDEKLKEFEEIKSITEAYYTVIINNIESTPITTS
jgi:ubiquinone/menaquinone biosynthesis C-methylase UbiE